MKFFILLIFFAILSCSNVNQDDISKVENALGVSLPYNCELIRTSETGIGESILTIVIKLEENEFVELLKKVDTSSFQRYQGNYYKNISIDERNTQHLLLLDDEFIIKYSEREI